MRRVSWCLTFFGLANSKIYFQEPFDKGWESRWTLSKWKHPQGKTGKIVAATGKFFNDEAENKGIQTKGNNRFFGLSASFESFSNEGKNLIIQYQAKYEKDVICGGGYLKIGPRLPDPENFGDPTPYNIMFGPDQCGLITRTHLIFSYKGRNVLKRSELPYKQDMHMSSLYRMILRPDNTVRVDINQQKIYEGSLKDDWDMLPPKEITDENDRQPSDWHHDSLMDDPAPNNTKPADWVDEKEIRDPNATKPEHWDDEEDGEWLAPLVKNPDYEGEWVPRRMANPNYKGWWKPRMIPNPEFYNDDHLYKYADFGFIGFDLWQVKGGTIFDNILITDDEAEADAFARRWKVLRDVEERKKKAYEATHEASKKRSSKKAKDDDADEEDKEEREEM